MLFVDRFGFFIQRVLTKKAVQAALGPSSQFLDAFIVTNK